MMTGLHASDRDRPERLTALVDGRLLLRHPDAWSNTPAGLLHRDGL